MRTCESLGNKTFEKQVIEKENEQHASVVRGRCSQDVIDRLRGSDCRRSSRIVTIGRFCSWYDPVLLLGVLHLFPDH